MPYNRLPYPQVSLDLVKKVYDVPSSFDTGISLKFSCGAGILSSVKEMVYI